MSDLPRPLRLLEDPAYLAFWRARHLCTVTTPRPDGSLHVTPMGIVLDPAGRRAWGVTSRTSVKARNLAADPRGVPVAVGSVEGRWWVSAEGRGTLLEDPEVVAEAERRYAERYRVPRANPARVAVRIELTRLLGSVPDPDPAGVVRAWHDALAAGNTRRALMLSRPDVVVEEPEGTATGTAALERWLDRSGAFLEPQDPITADGDTVLVREHAGSPGEDPDGADGTQGARGETWVEFTVADGLVSAVRSHGSPGQAPARPGLTPGW